MGTTLSRSSAPGARGGRRAARSASRGGGGCCWGDQGDRGGAVPDDHLHRPPRPGSRCIVGIPPKPDPAGPPPTLSASSSTGSLHSVRHTRGVRVSLDESGFKMYNTYTVLRLLGQGAYGRVKLCADQSGNLFAMKVIKYSLLRQANVNIENELNTSKRATLQSIRNEIAVMEALDSEYIVKLYEVIDDPERNKLYLIMEYMKRGCVLQLNELGVSVSGPIQDISTLRHYFLDLVHGVEYLHSQEILHFDIKPENLLISEEGHLKIVDFGVSRMCPIKKPFSSSPQSSNTSYGTPTFSPPECFSPDTISSAMGSELGIHQVDGYKADVWAIGVTFFCLAFGRVPFFSHSGYADLVSKIKSEEPSYPSDADSDLVDLLGHILQKCPSKRWDLSKIERHPWCVGESSTASRVDLVRQYTNIREKLTAEAVSSAIRSGNPKSLQLLNRTQSLIQISMKMKSRLNNVRRKLSTSKIERGYSFSSAESASDSRVSTFSDAIDSNDLRIIVENS